MRNRQIHLDFHTSEAIEKIGESFKKEQFQAAMRIIKSTSAAVFIPTAPTALRAWRKRLMPREIRSLSQ